MMVIAMMLEDVKESMKFVRKRAWVEGLKGLKSVCSLCKRGGKPPVEC